MSVERGELHRLVDELPEQQVPAVLAEARRRTRAEEPPPAWPPAFFGSFSSGRADLGTDHDDLLAESFGRSE